MERKIQNGDGKAMKLTKEQLVDLLSTATYGCDWLECKVLRSEAYIDERFDKEYLENRCREDKWADRLLNGGHIICFDYYDEDDNGDPKRYTICLEDIEEKLEKATKDEEVVRDYANWISGDYDYYDCNNLMQYVIFGEVVYG